jgi:mRNA-degrading endonuclease YafQ of YafQ-DinJ toxin-antitoxin module
VPTYELDERFKRDLERLSQEERKQLSRAVNKLVADLKARQGFRKGLRIKGVQGHEGIYEMTWAPDGRASFSYGTSPNAGDVHIVWRRVGSHDILQDP